MNENDIIKYIILRQEKRLFVFKLLSSVVGYIGITLWLNAIRTTTPIWFVWALIIIQFALYFSIFIVSNQRTIVFDLNKNISIILFTVLAILGRVNDWELIIIPLLVLIMLIISAKNNKLSNKENS